MEKDRNYFSEVGKYIRDNNISYHNVIEIVEKYFIDNNFNDNGMILLTHHIVDQIDLELCSPTILTESNKDIFFNPNFDYHEQTLSLLNEEDTNIHNLSDKVRKVFIDNNFSHNERLLYRHILMFNFNMKIFEARLKCLI